MDIMFVVDIGITQVRGQRKSLMGKSAFEKKMLFRKFNSGGSDIKWKGTYELKHNTA